MLTQLIVWRGALRKDARQRGDVGCEGGMGEVLGKPSCM